MTQLGAGSCAGGERAQPSSKMERTAFLSQTCSCATAEKRRKVGNERKKKKSPRGGPKLRSFEEPAGKCPHPQTIHSSSSSPPETPRALLRDGGLVARAAGRRCRSRSPCRFYSPSLFWFQPKKGPRFSPVTLLAVTTWRARAKVRCSCRALL